MDFEAYLTKKNDEIDLAAHALLFALIRTDTQTTETADVIPRDMAILAPIIEAAEYELIKTGHQVCHPYYEDETECYKTGTCNNSLCPLRHREEDSK